MKLDLNATTASATHLLYDGDGGWIEAKAVFHQEWIDIDPESDGWGWKFKDGVDCVRWLRS